MAKQEKKEVNIGTFNRKQTIECIFFFPDSLSFNHYSFPLWRAFQVGSCLIPTFHGSLLCLVSAFSRLEVLYLQSAIFLPLMGPTLDPTGE